MRWPWMSAFKDLLAESASIGAPKKIPATTHPIPMPRRISKRTRILDRVPDAAQAAQTGIYLPCLGFSVHSAAGRAATDSCSEYRVAGYKSRSDLLA